MNDRFMIVRIVGGGIQGYRPAMKTLIVCFALVGLYYAIVSLLGRWLGAWIPFDIEPWNDDLFSDWID